MFINYYFCPVCDYTWVDEWSCMCDDRCPVCNTPCSPEFSEQTVDEMEDD